MKAKDLHNIPDVQAAHDSRKLAIDQVGVKKFVAECDAFAKKYGNQFEVPKLLRDMAAKGESFYGKYHAAKAA